MPSGESHVAIIPYLCVHDAARAIEFYQQAFGAVEASRIVQDDGRVGHAEIRIGGAAVFLADEFPEIGFRSPRSLGGSPVLLHVTVPDVNVVFHRAVAAGATVLRPLADQGYGDRNGKLADPFGHQWMLSTPVGDSARA